MIDRMKNRIFFVLLVTSLLIAASSNKDVALYMRVLVDGLQESFDKYIGVSPQNVQPQAPVRP